MFSLIHKYPLISILVQAASWIHRIAAEPRQKRPIRALRLNVPHPLHAAARYRKRCALSFAAALQVGSSHRFCPDDNR